MTGDDDLREAERPAGPPVERRGARRARGFRRLLLLLAVPGLLLGGFGVYAMWAAAGAGDGRPVAIVIPEGATAGDIAETLAAKEVIRAPWLFTFVARFRDVDKDLRAGKYDMTTGQSYGAVIAALRKGPKVVFTRFTVPEGKLVDQVATIVAEKTHIKRADFLAAVRSGTHRSRYMPEDVKSLEGYLFPKTYDILEDATADDVVAMMVAQFDREAATLDWSKADALGVTPGEVVTIASLVEREAKLARERPTVAAVIYNRLAKPMRLQIDATVQYALYQRDGTYTTRVLYRDLEIASPYNTYRVDGLPPGPIASPGLDSLRAALNPEDVDYLFYVLIDPSGEHAFATTQAEHNRNVARARKGK